MMKTTEFLEYLEYQGIFWKNIFCKVYKGIYHQYVKHVKYISSEMQYYQLIIVFYFMRIFYILLKLLHFGDSKYHSSANFQSFWLPPLAQIFNQIKLFLQKSQLIVLILWKTREATQCSHIRLKILNLICVIEANFGKLSKANILKMYIKKYCIY